MLIFFVLIKNILGIVSLFELNTILAASVNVVTIISEHF